MFVKWLQEQVVKKKIKTCVICPPLNRSQAYDRELVNEMEGSHTTYQADRGTNHSPVKGIRRDTFDPHAVEVSMRYRLITLGLFALILCPGVSADASTLSEVFKKVSSSVVVIQTVQEEVVRGPIPEFTSMVGLGSGVLISKGGMVLTASHVVQTADEILVGFPSGEVLKARVVGSEPAADVALLELAELPQNPRPATLGNSDETEVGDEIFIVGAPLGLSHTLTVGNISARRKLNENTIFSGFASVEFFQTDAAINPGNSGGPMFNMKGEVIGIVSYKISQSGDYEGIGFGVTSNMARRLLLEERSVWSGVHGYLLTGELAQVFNLPQPAGFLIQRVAKGSLASRAGIKAGTIPATINEIPLILGGDIVLEVLGIPVNEKNHAKIKQAMSQFQLGEEISLTVFRGGKKKVLSTLRMRSP